LIVTRNQFSDISIRIREVDGVGIPDIKKVMFLPLAVFK